MEAFINLFETIGYTVCENGDLEEGIQKIALFEKDNEPTHAARQLPNGEWTSKLGSHIDVSHSLAAMEGGMYGKAVVFMARKYL